MEQSQLNKGIALIELLLAIAISSIIIGLAIQVMVLARSSFLSANIKYVSKDLLENTIDIVRSVKESDWESFAIEGVYHPQLTGDNWTLAPGDETITGTQFSRSIQIINVCRDTDLSIIECPSGTLDPDTKQIIIDVSWVSPTAGSISSSQLITRYSGNGFWTQTTQSDFALGRFDNVLATNTSDGELTLNPNTGPGWASASRVGNVNVTNSQTVNSIYVYDSRMFVVKDNDPGGQEFLIYSLSNPASPSLISATELASDGKKIIVENGFAYIATSDDSQELKIYNITDPTSPLPIGSLNLSGSTDAQNLGISGTRLYLIRAFDAIEKEFNTINIANAATPSLVSSQDFSDAITDMHIEGRYAYLSTRIDSQEVAVIDLQSSDVSSNVVGSYNISGNEDARAILYKPPYLYVSSAQNKIYILNASNPAAVSEAGQFNLAGIGDIYITDSKGFFVDASTAGGLYTFNLSDPVTPGLIGNHSIGSNSSNVIVNGAYAYATTASSSREIIVVQGGGSNFVTAGEYYSPTYDTTNGQTTIQSVDWASTSPAGTEVRFQLAVNSLGYGFEYVGPDGTSNSYYTTTGAYPLGENTGQYIKAKILLTSDGTSAPTISDYKVIYIQ